MASRRRTVRYAVVGLGHIAQAAVLPAFAHARRNTTLAALVTGSPKKAAQLAKKYRVPVHPYGHYDDLLRSGTVDAVYIALPNEMHHEFSVRALDAGVHVLCEKPLAVSSEQARQMVGAAERSGAKLMTAYRLHFDGPNLEAVKLCRRGKLGNLRTFVSSFSYVIQDRSNIRLRPLVGSGPLWDLGIYCINAARYLFQSNPTEVLARAIRPRRGLFTHVDESVSALLHFPDNRTAIITSSFGMAESSWFEVYGDKGMLRLQNAYEYAFPPELHTQMGDKRSVKKFKVVDQFAPELAYFADCILKDKPVEPSGREGLADVAIIEAIEASARTGGVVSVEYGGVRKTATPDPTMVERKPAVDEPELVDVRSASGG
jgi:glucose-fructose oxidoreductase